VPARAHGPCGGGALRAVRRATGGEWRLRLHGEGMGPGVGDLSTHPAGTHQPGLLSTGEGLLSTGEVRVCSLQVRQ